MRPAPAGPAPGSAAPAEAVVQALVENHRRFLAFVESRVRDRATAEEILQAAYVRGLEPEYAEILRRVDLAGERPAEVARSSGLTANNAMVRLHRARRALRTALERACRTCAEHGCLDCTCGAGVRVAGEPRLPG